MTPGSQVPNQGVFDGPKTPPNQKMIFKDVPSEKHQSSNSEEKNEKSEGSSESGSHKQEVINTADDAWRFYTEAQCGKILDNDPFNMQARFRSAQIWINNQENLEDAEKLLVSI